MVAFENKVIFKKKIISWSNLSRGRMSKRERERAVIASLTIWEISFRRGNKLDNILKFDHVIFRREEKGKERWIL